MKSSTLKRIQTITLHLIFWIGVWFLYFYFFSYNSDDRPYVIWFSSLLLPITIAITYFAVYFLIPRYLLKRKYAKFALYIFYVMVASSYFIVILIYGSLILLKKWDASNIPPMIKNFFFILILVYMIVGIVSFITILNLNFKTEKKNRELQNKILNTQLQIKEQELIYLKRQIHPHFLFNTLNTIYGFALKGSKQTPDIILKLSNLLDYILYQINKPLVPLQEEVLHITEYIELEKIRFQDTLIAKINTPDIDKRIQVAPMLLIPFVENAFKHGAIIDGFLKLDLDISLIGSELKFRISNSVKGQKIKDGKGIGLENIRKRLELNYAGNYALDIQNDKNTFSVELCIKNINKIENV